MALDPVTHRGNGTEHDAMTAQIAALRADFMELASSVQSSAASNGSAFAKDMSDTLNDAAGYVSRKGHAADLRLEGAIAANPYVALGLAAGFGLLLGAMTRR